jgi:serine/threonine-protein kinase
VPLKPGDRIERYVIDGPLGSGGMGEVYRAHDSRLKRSVALKILHSDPPADPVGKTAAPVSNPGARMLREAQLAASLDHPNVVAIFDVGQVEEPPELRGTTYLAMELIRGEPLRKYVGDASVKMKVRVRWLEEIARALGAAHAAGLVHRDVKPENVMIREDGIVKVLDFGIAKRTVPTAVDPTSSTEGYAVPTQTAHGMVVGTPFYMAPEQLRAEALDGRADQFAWGVVAYELLTGKPLWSLEGGGFSLVAQILQAPPPSMSAFAGVPPRVAAVVTRALSKSADARFPTMTALVEELTGRAEGTDAEPTMPVSASSVSSPELPASLGYMATQSAEISSAGDTQRSATARPPPTAQTTTVRSKPPPQPSRTKIGWAIAAGVATLAAGTLVVAMRNRTGPAAATTATLAADTTPSPGCKTNAECARDSGGPAICRKDLGRCVPLESQDCKLHADPEALASDDTIWIGELFPLTGAQSTLGHENDDAVDLARQDFEQASMALRADHGARPVALVSCDDAADAKRAATHLVEDVHVPAILGFRSGGELIELAGSLLGPRHVIALATMTQSPLVTQIPRPAGEPPIVWRTTSSGSESALALAKLVATTIEPALRSAGVRRTRVALVRTKSAGSLAIAERLFDTLRFNGTSALDNGSDYRDFAVDTDADAGTATAIANLAQFAPHVVIRVGVDDFVSTVIAPLEKAWPAREAVLPRYLDIGSFSDDEIAFAGRDASRRRRFFGVVLPSTTQVNARFTMHYNGVRGTNLSRTDVSNSEYDAFYVVAYAAFALAGAPPTGPNLASAIRRFAPSGARIEVGPSGIFQAFTLLSSGASINLIGAAGTLDFDLATGEREADLAVLCMDVGPDGRASGGLESGLTYQAHTGEIVGQAKCP